MLDIGWSELLVIVVVLVVVVGPKELPGVLRTFGTWMAKARSLSREFQSSMNQLAREVDQEKVKVATPPPLAAIAAESDPTGASPAEAGDKATPEGEAETASEPAVNASADEGEAETASELAVSDDETKAAPASGAAAAPATAAGAAKDDEEAESAASGDAATWAAPGPPPNPGILTSTPPADLTASPGVAGKSNGSGRVDETATDETALAATPTSAGER